MTSLSTLARPNTVSFKLDYANDSRISYEEVARAVNRNFDCKDISCLQPRGNNSYWLTFKHPTIAFLATNKGLLMDNRRIEIQPVSGGLMWVKVTNAPFEMSNDSLAKVLSYYGDIKKIEYVQVDPDLGGYCNGDRKVLMSMKRKIPNILNIQGYEVVLWYRNVEKQCRRCGQAGHLAIECDTPAPTIKRCSICNNRWHMAENCSGCPDCRTDAHTREACPMALQKQQQQQQQLPLSEPQQQQQQQQQQPELTPETTVIPPVPSKEDIDIFTSTSQIATPVTVLAGETSTPTTTTVAQQSTDNQMTASQVPMETTNEVEPTTPSPTPTPPPSSSQPMPPPWKEATRSRKSRRSSVQSQERIPRELRIGASVSPDSNEGFQSAPSSPEHSKKKTKKNETPSNSPKK